MRTIDFFVEWTERFYNTLEKIANLFPCFVSTECVEMNWREVQISARQEDMARIENLLAEFI